jgi:hypothetical protein
MSGGMSFLGKIMMTPSRRVSLSTSTRNPIIPDSWIRQIALTSRVKSGSGGLPRPPARPLEIPLMVCSVTGRRMSAR